MLKKEFVFPLKAYKISTMGKDVVVSTFPALVANCCRMATITNVQNKNQNLCYDWTKFMEFRNNLSIVIMQNQFEYLDNIIIDFFKTYNYEVLRDISTKVRFTIQFPDEAIQTFTSRCNAFKGKEWDDILDGFVDALYDFLNSGTIHNQTPK